jgi:pimeloyl-ACP methyl ester carboxylesterase
METLRTEKAWHYLDLPIELCRPWTGPKPLGKVPAAVPVLHLWGEEDNALKRSAVEASGKHCEGEYKLVVMPCGHWMMQAAGAACVREILDHAAAHPIGAQAAKL